jgi:UDP-N-acetylglucosamine 2-epimerase (non-hydrolysing)
MIAALDQAWLLMTDSGGLQEEAPTFHLPVLVLREKSERMEAVESGSALLCGTSTEKLVEEVERLLTDAQAYKAMSLAPNPFGDGKAAMRITEIIKHTFKPSAPKL